MERCIITMACNPHIDMGDTKMQIALLILAVICGLIIITWGDK